MLKNLICKIFHDGYHEVNFYDPQERCYTAKCTKCGRKTYVGAGKVLPVGFAISLDTNPRALNLVTPAQLKTLVSTRLYESLVHPDIVRESERDA